jgi:glycosyltransferase involved in cell wall biosynthesis
VQSNAALVNGAVRRIDVALDARLTSHMSAGMSLYVRKLDELLPRVAPDLHVARIGRGDNFDLAEQLELPLTIALRRPRLVHIPGPFVPLIVPAPFILTIHDLIDLHFPEFGKRKVGPYYRYGVGPVARRARAVITDDESTAADLERLLGVDPARLRIIPLGVDVPPPADRAAGATQHPARPYFLYVGNHRGHKNLLTLARAWAALPVECEVDLLLTGRDDIGAAFAAYTRDRGRIVFTGDVSERELGGLYRGACAYVHPALREGFGLPMLEAMRCATPVIAASTALPRVLAPHAFVFAPNDCAELGALLRRALVDEPAHFAAAGAAAQRATRELTWERTARATAAVYREFLT